MIFYSHYCNDCHLSFYSKKKRGICKICKGKNVTHGYKRKRKTLKEFRL